MTQNEHVYAICCRQEVAGDVISGENVKTIEGYAVVNFEVTSFSSFQDIKNHFVTATEADIDDSIKRKRVHVSLKNGNLVVTIHNPIDVSPYFVQSLNLVCPKSISAVF